MGQPTLWHLSKCQDSKAEFEGDGDPVFASDGVMSKYFSVCVALSNLVSEYSCFRHLHIICLHGGYLSLFFLFSRGKTKFLNGNSAENRIPFVQKLGCMALPECYSTLSWAKMCNHFMPWLDERKNTDSRKYDFICFSQLLIFFFFCP